MEINMILQPTGVLGVQITVGEKEYRKQFDKLPAVFPTDEGTVAFSQITIPCQQFVRKI